jgi:hypothetical protein
LEEEWLKMMQEEYRPSEFFRKEKTARGRERAKNKKYSRERFRSSDL